MTEEKERRFKIKQIEKYNGELDDRKRRIISSCLLIAGCALCQYGDYYKGYASDALELRNLVYGCGYLLHSINLADALIGKNKIKQKIEQLKEEFGPLYEQYLEEYNQEVNRGRGR